MPSALKRLVRNFFAFCQHGAYAWFFSVEVLGAEHVPERGAGPQYHFLMRPSTACLPARGGLIIAANHTSHLDMGLIKYSMGPAGRDLVSLAAQDYFFSNPLNRWFFGNFTNLLSFNRSKSLKESLLAAGRELKNGRNLLIFPEGTRTRDGLMGAFKPSLGYMALNFEADVLPVYISGAFGALPRGKIVPRARRLKAVFGPVIPFAALKEAVAAASVEDANRAATKVVEDAVRKLEREARGEV
ncbi:MAG TPA: lysophospholipid acyltransferase family protein [Elusimicrobiota bacterium]|nr:lysophospholipid acyltransferase family protein [Elusimicrobiota bacterium]